MTDQPSSSLDPPQPTSSIIIKNPQYQENSEQAIYPHVMSVLSENAKSFMIENLLKNGVELNTFQEFPISNMVSPQLQPPPSPMISHPPIPYPFHLFGHNGPHPFMNSFGPMIPIIHPHHHQFPSRDMHPPLLSPLQSLPHPPHRPPSNGVFLTPQPLRIPIMKQQQRKRRTNDGTPIGLLKKTR